MTTGTTAVILASLTSTVLTYTSSVPTLPPTASVDQVTAWIEKYLEVRGAFVIRWGPQLLLEVKPETIQRNGDRVRVWVDAELYGDGVSPGNALRSSLELQEYDCTQGRERSLAHSLFRDIRQRGSDSVSEDTPNAAWEFIRPGSNIADIAARVCDPKWNGDLPPA